jgi:hypothetical protein
MGETGTGPGVLSTGGAKLYDSTMRRLVEPDINLPVIAGWLDPSRTPLTASAYVKRPGSLTATTLEVDLLVEIMGGPDGPELMHVEYQVRPEKDFVLRMLAYRTRLMQRYPGVRLTQHVIVLKDGVVSGHDDPGNGFTLDLKVLYLREHDPADFLSHPVLAPLAVLARGSPQEREQTLLKAFHLIRSSGHPRGSELHQAAASLASLRLGRPTIESLRRESEMSVEPIIEFYRDTEWGQGLQAIGRAEGFEQGREQGREQGIEQGIEQGQARILLALLRARFGQHPQLSGLAERLAAWNESEAVEAITGATSLVELLKVQAPDS